MNQSKLYDLATLLGTVEDLQPGEKVTAESEIFSKIYISPNYQIIV